jgi:adenine/guanine/hypoxanthine permease
MPPSLLFVNGTLMRGLALHRNLEGAEFIEATTTAPAYRLHSIGDRHPGMFHVDSGGVAIAGELYRLSAEVLDRVIANEPSDLYVGNVELADARVVPGILYPQELAKAGHRDISEHGGWRAYADAQEGRRSGGSATSGRSSND